MAGKITALKYQKKNRDRVSIFIEDRFVLGVPVIVAASLRKGQFLSDSEIESLREQGGTETAYSQALNFLSYRPRSRAETVEYLGKRGLSETQIESVVTRLERARLLDDEAFAQYWVENRERFRPRGARALRYELRTKGISETLIDAALASVDLSASAYRAASRKAQQLSNLDEATFRKKLVGYLARRGFDYEVAQETAEHYWRTLGTND
jgi:regulatory protein